MSLKTYFEFFLNLKEFKCLDLYNQGLYMQRIQIYEEKDGQINYAQPYNFEEGLTLQKKNDQNNFFYKAEIKDDEYYYQSKSFLVKYQQENIMLDESIQFRLETEAYPNFKEINLNFVSTLYFADLSKIGSKQESDFFQKACVFKMKINQYWKSINEFLPILFDENHFCLTQATFHCNIVDLRFKLNDTQLKIINDIQVKDNQQSFPQNKFTLDLLTPKTFLEYMNSIVFKYGKSQLNSFYDEYILNMRQQYQELSQFYQKLINYSSNNHQNLSQQFIPKQLEQSNFVRKYQAFFLNKQKDSQGQYKIGDLLIKNDYKEKQLISEVIQEEILEIAGMCLELWQHCTIIIKKRKTELIKDLQKEYTKTISEKWGEWQFRNVIETDDFSQGLSLKEEHKKIAQQIRKAPIEQFESQLKLFDCNMFPKQDVHPVIFQEIYNKKNKNQYSKQFISNSFINNDTQKIKKNSLSFNKNININNNLINNNVFNNVFEIKEQQKENKNSQQLMNNTQQNYEGTHLLILVHGFQGSSYDMRSLRNNILLMLIRKSVELDKYEFLCSSANEDSTENDIAEMGQNLANEVKYKIQELKNIQ